MKADPDKKRPVATIGLGAAASFGTTFMAYVVAFTLGGLFIDRRRGAGHWFLILGLFLGFAGGIYEFWKLLKQLDKQDTDDTRED